MDNGAEPWWADWRLTVSIMSVPLIVAGYWWAFSISWRAALLTMFVGLYSKMASRIMREYGEELQNKGSGEDRDSPPESVEVTVS